MFQKILIANRGEIACRIIRTARKMGILTTAVYSAADKNSLHVLQADEAFYIGPAPAKESYLNIPAILKIAQECGAQAIHPGYGFLSENAEFAAACEQAGIVFIGPSINALNIMGSKQLAKQHLAAAIPLIPGYHADDQSDPTLLKEAKKIGFPVLIKAANGGGGKGMRTVHTAEEFLPALAAARREALSSFADDTMILEKLIQDPRHIEIQIMADHFGNVVHLFERDCSIQRRHQKVIEEAPADQLPTPVREQLAAAAIAVARAIEYRGAGTIECLVDAQQQFYFMEMNTRLQVEHPVTEMITGLDLVEWQILIAAQQPLPCPQSEIKAQGHAIECRIYAEDPGNDFLPSTGLIRFLRTGSQEHVRIDTGIAEQSQISMFYDPMLAKIIAWGSNREEARLRLLTALRDYHLGGVKTNRSFLMAILQHTDFQANTFTTNFLNQTDLKILPMDLEQALITAAAIRYLQLNQEDDPLYKDCFAWQMHLQSYWFWTFRHQNETYTVKVTAKTLHACTIHYQDQSHDLMISCTTDQVSIENGQQRRQCFFDQQAAQITLYTDAGPFELQCIEDFESTENDTHPKQMTAPMPGTIVSILKQLGDQVAAGDALMILEAMKMEHTIRAPHAGKVREIFYPLGAQVPEGVTLAALEPL